MPSQAKIRLVAISKVYVWIYIYIHYGDRNKEGKLVKAGEGNRWDREETYAGFWLKTMFAQKHKKKILLESPPVKLGLLLKCIFKI